jgi:hypothetical protein
MERFDPLLAATLAALTARVVWPDSRAPLMMAQATLEGVWVLSHQVDLL